MLLIPGGNRADEVWVTLLRDDPPSAHRELLQLATSLSCAGSTEEIFELVTNVLPGLSSAIRVSMTQIDELEPDVLTVVALHGEAGAFATGDRVAMSGTLAGEVVRAEASRTWALEEHDSLETDLLVELGITHATNAPLLAAGRCYGTLNASFVGAPTIEEAELVEQLGLLIASQLDRLEAQRALEREVAARLDQTEKLARLHNIEAQLSRAENLDDLVRVLSESITSVVPVQRVSYAEVGPAPGVSTLHGIVGMGGLAAGTVIPLDEAEFDRRFAEAKSSYNPDHRASAEAVHRQLLEAGFSSSMNIGIFVNDRAVGTLNVGCIERDGLSSADRALLQTLASFMGSTLERIEAHTRLAFEAHHDSLTGLIRRQIFDERLEGEIEALRGTDATSAICFIDVDRFKLVNDTAGHEAGDLVLRQATERLGNCLGPDDVLSRVGGDEFVMILRRRDRGGYEALCNDIIEAIANAPFIAGDRVIASTISMGLAFVDATTATAQEAVGAADAACYAAKSRGGNRVSIASPRDDEQHARRTAGPMLFRLEASVDRDELQLYGQPIRAIGPRGISAIEVLVRMHDDRKRMLEPGRFIPVAERYGFITKVDSWVVRAALGAARRSIEQNSVLEHTQLFVNLSPSSISTDGFSETIADLVTASGVDPTRLCFEITETGTMRNFEAAVRFVEELRTLGVQFALDDFGVGLSSISHLQLLPVDYLKIDGSLIRGIESNPLNATMVSSIKAMADAMGVSTIAEHTENRATLDILAHLGVQSAQGYFLGHPAPLDRVLGTAVVEPAHRANVTALRR